MRYTPRPVQEECLSALAGARDGGRRRALAVVASGIGKTVIAAHDVKRYLKESGETRAFLFLCHDNNILEQARATFQAVLGKQFILGILNGRRKDLHVVNGLFASFQTMAGWREEFDPEEFCYVVVDESHHSHAPTYLPTIRYFRPYFLAGYTATPERTDLQDIREIYGREVYSLPLEIALARGLLTRVDYRLITDEIQDLQRLRTSEGRLSIKALNRKLFVRYRDEQIVKIIKERSREVKSPHVVIFCPSIKHCDRIAGLIPRAVAIHSGVDQKTRNERLEDFRSQKVGTVVTVDMFNEGVDIPEANVIVFLRSTSSRLVFFQQLGRGLRKLKGKRKVLVLDFVANCERLEMILELWRGIQHASDSIGIDEEALLVNCGKIEFTEVAQEVLEIIEVIRGGYTREFLLIQLQKLGRELGRAPTEAEVKAYGIADIQVFVTLFGSFENALLRAGLIGTNPWALKVITRKRYSQDELIRMIKDHVEKTGKAPTARDARQGRASGAFADIGVFYKAFGSWNGALRAAGLFAKLERNFTDEELIEHLKLLEAKIGRVPRMADVDSHAKESDCPGSKLFQKRFGRWSKALEAADMVPAFKYYDNLDELRAILRKAAKRLGFVPDPTQFSELVSTPKPYTFTNRFGSWEEALKSAGLGPIGSKVNEN